jgi:2-iminobutanoate/2-iminopropanoate deaminase
MSTIAPHYSLTRQAGDLVFVSGRLPFGEGRDIVGDDITAQTRQCLHNLAQVLAGEGLDLGDVVKTTVWITRSEDFEAFNAAYAEHFPTDPPARSTVCAELAVPGALIEIEAIALKSS